MAISDKTCSNCGAVPCEHSPRCPRPKYIGAPDNDAVVTADELRSLIRGRVPCYCDGDCRCTQKYALARLEDQLKDAV